MGLGGRGGSNKEEVFCREKKAAKKLFPETRGRGVRGKKNSKISHTTLGKMNGGD